MKNLNRRNLKTSRRTWSFEIPFLYKAIHEKEIRGDSLAKRVSEQRC